MNLYLIVCHSIGRLQCPEPLDNALMYLSGYFMRVRDRCIPDGSAANHQAPDMRVHFLQQCTVAMFSDSPMCGQSHSCWQ